MTPTSQNVPMMAVVPLAGAYLAFHDQPWNRTSTRLQGTVSSIDRSGDPSTTSAAIHEEGVVPKSTDPLVKWGRAIVLDIHISSTCFRLAINTLVATITLCRGTVLSHFPNAISVRPAVSAFGGTGYISAASYHKKDKAK